MCFWVDVPPPPAVLFLLVFCRHHRGVLLMPFQRLILLLFSRSAFCSCPPLCVGKCPRHHFPNQVLHWRKVNLWLILQQRLAN